MKKNNGFTLAEVLGVIVLLGFLVIVVIPPIVNQIIRSKDEISDATLKLIYSATELYAEKNANDYPIYNGSVYCITLQSLVDSGELKTPIRDIKTGKEIELDKMVKMEIVNVANINYDLVESANCEAIRELPPSIPELASGMIPIYWDSNKVIRKADVNNSEGEHQWYDYRSQKWANAVLVDDAARIAYKNLEPGEAIAEANILAYLVWIPRYRYKLFNEDALERNEQEIRIEFEGKIISKSNGEENGEWLTHPGFTFGNEEINGFWVGKFETTGDDSKPTVKPGVESLRSQDISTQFTTAKKFNNEITYGITSNYDAHMMKNMEWGAVAYLSHSKYGKYGNSEYEGDAREISINDSEFYTGGGTSNAYIENTEQSTTGNIYGIYDMSGGAFEYVMGGMYTDATKTEIIRSSSEFTSAQLTLANSEFIGLKYIDIYEYGTSVSDYSHRHLGDATGETRGWYSDYANFVSSSAPWFYRGGNCYVGTGAGVFYFYSGYGTPSIYSSFRLAVSVVSVGT